jgi:hypothetical protein
MYLLKYDVRLRNGRKSVCLCGVVGLHSGGRGEILYTGVHGSGSCALSAPDFMRAYAHDGGWQFVQGWNLTLCTCFPPALTATTNPGNVACYEDPCIMQH